MSLSFILHRHPSGAPCEVRQRELQHLFRSSFVFCDLNCRNNRRHVAEGVFQASAARVSAAGPLKLCKPRWFCNQRRHPMPAGLLVHLVDSLRCRRRPCHLVPCPDDTGRTGRTYRMQLAPEGEERIIFRQYILHRRASIGLHVKFIGVLLRSGSRT